VIRGPRPGRAAAATTLLPRASRRGMTRVQTRRMLGMTRACTRRRIATGFGFGFVIASVLVRIGIHVELGVRKRLRGKRAEFFAAHLKRASGGTGNTAPRRFFAERIFRGQIRTAAVIAYQRTAVIAYQPTPVNHPQCQRPRVVGQVPARVVLTRTRGLPVCEEGGCWNVGNRFGSAVKLRVASVFGTRDRHTTDEHVAVQRHCLGRYHARVTSSRS